MNPASDPRVDYDQVKAETMAGFNDRGPDHINCAQSMVHLTLGILGRDTSIITAAQYLGGGVSSTGGTCGAITGSALGLGLRDYYEGADPDSVAATKEALQGLIASFEHEFGACGCRDLTGHDLRTPEGMEAFKNSEASERCPVYISWMSDHLFPILAGELEQA